MVLSFIAFISSDTFIGDGIEEYYRSVVTGQTTFVYLGQIIVFCLVLPSPP